MLRALLPASGMGLDNRRWAGPPRGGHEFLVDDVLRLSARKIRIGFYIAGSAANFAARTKDRVLRDGGLLWIDSYLCQSDKRKKGY